MASVSAAAGGLRVIARPAFKDGSKTPYNTLLYSALRDLGVRVAEYRSSDLLCKPWDVWHFHWPESFIEVSSPFAAWMSARKYRLLFELARRRGIKIVWTVHDLVPHDVVYPRIELPFWQDVIRRADAVIALTQNGLSLARQRYPFLQRVPAFVIPHGHLRDAYPRSMRRNEARRLLGLAPEQFVVTYFGQIRPYKNVPLLIRVARRIADPDFRLLVCGRLSKRADLEREIVAATGDDPRVRLVLRYIESAEIQIYLAAADLLVLPYNEILNSGSAILGLSFDRPILVPNLGAMGELAQAVGREWVRTYDGDLDPRVLAEAITWAKQELRGNKPRLDRLDWPLIGRQTLGAYEDVIRGRA